MEGHFLTQRADEREPATKHRIIDGQRCGIVDSIESRPAVFDTHDQLSTARRWSMRQRDLHIAVLLCGQASVALLVIGVESIGRRFLILLYSQYAMVDCI